MDWYDSAARVLPWRARPGETAVPYHVWLSEIMLQQTTVATVIPYFERFVGRWPDIDSLAAAPLDHILHAWQGLGYYARARNLHRCARLVAGERDGQFPVDEAALRDLPGIGRYTAAAIAAIAFDKPATVVDGNVERIMARLFAVETPLPDSRPRLYELATRFVDPRRPGDLAQGLMDLGATVCTPRQPACDSCPLGEFCAARKAGIAAALPRRVRRPAKPHRHGLVYWLWRDGGTEGAEVLVTRRPEKGLLGGMTGFPGTDWREGDPPAPASAAPAILTWQPLETVVRHSFTHFHLRLRVMTGKADRELRIDGAGDWWPVARLAEKPLPTVMKKVVRAVFETLPDQASRATSQ